ncbi:hypothetical protein F5Y04DRAFT_179090 [Hypomontagnella monticulosa]|nr:hypothetical protein F5Y04DRAFT_179090 [Hypomontagnella monticulosa]
MSSMIKGISAAFGKSPAPNSVNGDKEPRGIKRKAKGDPYDDIDEDDSEPVRKTPSSLRTRSRISSEAPSSSTKGRLASTSASASKVNKRRSRSQADRGAEAVDATANLTRAKQPQAARLRARLDEEQPQTTLVPEANMGAPQPPGNNSVNPAPNGTANDDSVPAEKTTAKNDVKGKSKATETDPTEEKPEVDQREEKEVKGILAHRMASDNSGRVELLIQWVGEEEEEATWEMEEEIQDGADEILYAYWKAQGGRIKALFITPKDPPAEVYHVYRILGHDKRARGGFEFEVQWVGHPVARGETTMEAETKLRKIAPEPLKEYWKDVGGRDKFLAKRGRGKKQRTE